MNSTEVMRQINSSSEGKKRTLLILDLNGVLIDRRYSPKAFQSENATASRVGNFIVWKRQGCERFLTMVFNHVDVAVWSSGNSFNVAALTQNIFGERKKELVFVWDQSKCKSVEDPRGTSKKRVYLKNLSDVWKAFPQYDESNTLIVDDTALKMRNNPCKNVLLTQMWKRTDRNNALSIDKGIMREIAYRILFD